MLIGYGLSKALQKVVEKYGGKNIKAPLTAKNAKKNAETVVISIESRVTKEVLAKMPRLKKIITASTGIDHIDVEECKKRNIEVCNCPTYSANAVAELAIALALCGLRNIPAMVRKAKNLEYGFHLSAEGRELRGQRCAVFGTGNIGGKIAKKLLCLGATVLAFSRTPKKELIEKGVKYVDLEKALKCDLAFIALPHTRATHHFFNKERLGKMKRGAAIVNISRGELIEGRALLEKIDKFLFVASDVVEGEAALWLGKKPSETTLKLINHPKFIITPHIGASTEEAKKNLIKEVEKALNQ